jgi:hypothetical protein
VSTPFLKKAFNFSVSPLNIAVKRSATNAVSCGVTGGEGDLDSMAERSFGVGRNYFIVRGGGFSGTPSTSNACSMKLLRCVFGAYTEELDCTTGTAKGFDDGEAVAVFEAR